MKEISGNQFIFEEYQSFFNELNFFFFYWLKK